MTSDDDLVERLNRRANEKRNLAAEWRSREIDDKWDEQAALAFEYEAHELEEAASEIRRLREALGPFANQIRAIRDSEFGEAAIIIRVADLERATTALASASPRCDLGKKGSS